MQMMQPTIESLSTFEVKYDLRHKIRSLFCNGLSTFVIIWPKKIKLLILLPCGSYCFVPLPHSVVDGSVVFDCGIYWSSSLAFW